MYELSREKGESQYPREIGFVTVHRLVSGLEIPFCTDIMTGSESVYTTFSYAITCNYLIHVYCLRILCI